jgi:hypothetical protein
MQQALNGKGAVIGALVFVPVIVILYVVLGLLPVTAIVVGALTLVGYIAATVAAKASTTTESKVTGFTRGALVGINSALNACLSVAILGSLFNTTTGVIYGVVAGIVNLLAVFGPISRGVFYQGVIGWSNWLLPMSWLIVALGMLFYLISALGHAIFTWLAKLDFFRIKGGTVDWRTGTFFIHGGWVSNLNYLQTAFNMGNFSFVHRKSGLSSHLRHEAGHTLNLGAFGSVFHLIGAIDENLPVIGSGGAAFSELLANSNDPAPGDQIDMWA